MAKHHGYRDGYNPQADSPELVAGQWLQNAEQDLEVANTLFTAGYYGWAAFACQQAIEKLIKGAYVKNRRKIPPHVHKIQRLFAIMKLDPPEDYINSILEIDQCYTSTRYPGYKHNFYCRSKESSQEILKKTRETYAWLRQELQL